MNYPELELQEIESHDTWVEYLHTPVPNFDNYPLIQIHCGLHKLEKRICQIEEKLNALVNLRGV